MKASIQEFGDSPSPSDGSKACPFSPPGPATPSSLSLHRIFVPLDFSPCSIKALQYAVPLARQFRARLCLLHVAQGYYPISPVGPLDPASADALARGDAA